MALAEQSRVREIVTGSTSDTSYDTMIAAKMIEADQQIKDELFLAAKKLGNVKSLPVIDTANATINGDSVPQHVKDMASNRAGSLTLSVLRQRDLADDYMKISKSEIAGYVSRLETDTGTSVLEVV